MTRLGHHERGSVLIAVLIVTAAISAGAAAAAGAAGGLATELRARTDVLCARFAARSALAVGPGRLPPETLAALIDPRITDLTIVAVSYGPDWCAYRATARCGSAIRTLEQTQPTPTPCTPPPLARLRM